MLRALLNEVGPDERIVTIEDNLELGVDRYPDLHPDVVALEAREENVEGEGEIDLATLVRWGLRMNPDRVIVGEVRGHEVIPMLNAMSQGNDGSMCTVHANSSLSAFSKLAMYAVQAPSGSTSRRPTSWWRTPSTSSSTSPCRPAARARAACGATSRRCGGRRRRGPLVVSNEIFVPGYDKRAIPGSQDSTQGELAEVGFDASVLLRPDGWWN